MYSAADVAPAAVDARKCLIYRPVMHYISEYLHDIFFKLKVQGLEPTPHSWVLLN